MSAKIIRLDDARSKKIGGDQDIKKKVGDILKSAEPIDRQSPPKGRKSTTPSGGETLSQNITGNNNLQAAGDINVYNNPPVIKRKTQYAPQPGDISGEQANQLKDLVNKAVEYEAQVKRKPKKHGAIWSALNKEMGVTYYREIKACQFEKAKQYVAHWGARLKRGLKRADEEEYRKERQKAIFAAARNQLGWTKERLDAYILAKYGKDSIRYLAVNELEQLYNIIMSLKKR